MSQVTHLDGQVAVNLEVGFRFGKGWTVMSTSQQELFCGGHLNSRTTTRVSCQGQGY